MLPENACTTGSILFDFHAKDHIDPPFSHLWVCGLVGALVYCTIRSRQHRATSLRLARESDAAVDPDAPLAVGARFVCGQVEYAEGQKSAIKVRVKQNGTEIKGKDGWTHEWTESSRTTRAQPFYVRRPDGERVRVEPGDKPLLVDKPNQIISKTYEVRTRIAKLTPGEDVIVLGVLAKGHDPESQHAGDYRSSGQSWVMTTAPGQRMEVSTEELGVRHIKRAQAFRKRLNLLVGMLSLVSVVFIDYPFRLFAGVDTCAEVLKKDTSVTVDSKGRSKTRYTVQLRVDGPDKPIVEHSLDDGDWDQLRTSDFVGYRNVADWPFASNVGTGVSMHYWSIIIAAFATLIGCSVYRLTLNYRRWYEGKLEDRGKGRLPNNPSETADDNE